MPKEGMKPILGPLLIGEADGGDHRVGCDGLIDDVRISKIVRVINGVPKTELKEDADTIGLWRFDKEEGLAGDPAWTPPPQSGKVEPWEKETDVNWVTIGCARWIPAQPLTPPSSIRGQRVKSEYFKEPQSGSVRRMRLRCYLIAINCASQRSGRVAI